MAIDMMRLKFCLVFVTADSPDPTIIKTHFGLVCISSCTEDIEFQSQWFINFAFLHFYSITKNKSMISFYFRKVNKVSIFDPSEKNALHQK